MSTSHCQLVLEALADGHWHSTASLYRECGGMILHSRIADLRRRGHTIEHRHVGGQGASAHEYRLLADESSRITELTTPTEAEILAFEHGLRAGHKAAR